MESFFLKFEGLSITLGWIFLLTGQVEATTCEISGSKLGYTPSRGAYEHPVRRSIYDRVSIPAKWADTTISSDGKSLQDNSLAATIESTLYQIQGLGPVEHTNLVGVLLARGYLESAELIVRNTTHIDAQGLVERVFEFEVEDTDWEAYSRPLSRILMTLFEKIYRSGDIDYDLGPFIWRWAQHPALLEPQVLDDLIVKFGQPKDLYVNGLTPVHYLQVGAKGYLAHRKLEFFSAFIHFEDLVINVAWEEALLNRLGPYEVLLITGYPQFNLEIFRWGGNGDPQLTGTQAKILNVLTRYVRDFSHPSRFSKGRKSLRRVELSFVEDKVCLLRLGYRVIGNLNRLHGEDFFKLSQNIAELVTNETLIKNLGSELGGSIASSAKAKKLPHPFVSEVILGRLLAELNSKRTLSLDKKQLRNAEIRLFCVFDDSSLAYIAEGGLDQALALFPVEDREQLLATARLHLHEYFDLLRNDPLVVALESYTKLSTVESALASQGMSLGPHMSHPSRFIQELGICTARGLPSHSTESCDTEPSVDFAVYIRRLERVRKHINAQAVKDLVDPVTWVDLDETIKVVLNLCREFKI